MNFKLNEQGTLPEEIKRATLEQIDSAVRQLQRYSRNRAKSIHETRKSLKRLRALLRMLRSTMDRKTLRREERVFRATARRLAPLREAHVRRENLKKLLADCRGEVGAEESARLSSEILNPPSNLSAVDLAELRDRLEQSRRRIESWNLEAETVEVFRNDLRRVYRKGRRDFRRAGKRPTAANLHDWRTNVKRLWYQLTLLQVFCSQPSRIDQLDKLAELLGDEHDLAELRSLLKKVSDTPKPLVALIKERRSELQKEALALGAEIYAEKPKAFSSSILTTYPVAPEPPAIATPPVLETRGTTSEPPPPPSSASQRVN